MGKCTTILKGIATSTILVSDEVELDLESLIDKYLEEENARIGEYNRKIAKEEMAKKKLYS